MRIISFSTKWDKLKAPEFTTFRFPRKDKDWYIGEEVQVFFKNRTPHREFLGTALITGKALKLTGTKETDLTEAEARADGFSGIVGMYAYMVKTYGEKYAFKKPMNKLTLTWF